MHDDPVLQPRSGQRADVPELPGCFASSDTLNELFEPLQEGGMLSLIVQTDQGGCAVGTVRGTLLLPLVSSHSR